LSQGCKNTVRSAMTCALSVEFASNKIPELQTITEKGDQEL